MTAPVTDALPYGIRDIKLTKYVDAAGMVLGSTSVDLPYIQQLNFAEAEEFQELRGDDKLITTRGRGSQVNWDLESGGVSSAAWQVFSGGEIIEVGLAPNRDIVYNKKATQNRPYFRIDGRIVSDSGGDILVRIYRCRANADIAAPFQDGEFATTRVGGVGLPLLDDSNDLIYSIFRRETSKAISLTPDPNPVPAPLNLTVGVTTTTSAALLWNPVVGVTNYKIRRSTDNETTWTAGTPATSTTANVTQTGLTAGDTVAFQVAAVIGTAESEWSPSVIVTLPSA